jgi:hypothetical protein
MPAERPRRSRNRWWLAAFLVLCCSPLRAAEAPVQEPPRSAEQTVAPPAELLEFLGQWETGSEEWVDPLELERLMREVEDEDGGSL